MNEPTPVAWHNGQIVSLLDASPSIASPSLHLGIGVFDGIMAYWNDDHYYIHRGDRHLQRFCRGAQNIGLGFSWPVAQLQEAIQELLGQVPAAAYYIRPIAYRGGCQIMLTDTEGTAVDVSIFGIKVARSIGRGLSCHFSAVERISSRAIPVSGKICGTYVNSYLARRTAELSGYDDAVLLDREGRIAEASAANIFFIEKKKLVTPPLNSDIFPGITRETVIDIARKNSIVLVEENLRPADLNRFEGAFLASTLMELRPITVLGDHSYKTPENEVFKFVLKEFQTITTQ